MMTKNNLKRIIIGQGENAGLPISAPIDVPEEGAIPKSTLRWRHNGTHFWLEQWKLENPRNPITRGIWVEVPCVES